ncbi:hypothetical protein STEG23_024798 [Scotinomys teguina]
MQISRTKVERKEGAPGESKTHPETGCGLLKEESVTLCQLYNSYIENLGNEFWVSSQRAVIIECSAVALEQLAEWLIKKDPVGWSYFSGDDKAGSHAAQLVMLFEEALGCGLVGENMLLKADFEFQSLSPSPVFTLGFLLAIKISRDKVPHEINGRKGGIQSQVLTVQKCNGQNLLYGYDDKIVKELGSKGENCFFVCMFICGIRVPL